jgi:hypothetical protein
MLGTSRHLVEVGSPKVMKFHDDQSPDLHLNQGGPELKSDALSLR